MTSPRPRGFPFERLARIGHDELAIHAAMARQLAARARGARFELVGGRLEKLVGGPVRVTSIRRAAPTFDPNAVHAELRFGSHAIAVAGSGAIRVIAQRLLGGPDELAAPRPPTAAEQAIWGLLLAAALADARIAADCWPLSDAARAIHERELVIAQRELSARQELIGRGGLIVDEPTVAGSRNRAKPEPTNKAGVTAPTPAPTPPAPGEPAPTTIERSTALIGIELGLDVAGTGLVVVAWCPPALVMQPPQHRLAPEWLLDLPIVVARCALPGEAIHRLAVRDVIVVGKELTLVIGDGGLPLVAAEGSLVATVATGYVRADMGLPDDAHLELTVRLGTTRMSLRRIGELAVGEVIALGRPLAGPYEIHVGGRAIGQGELVDIDGEVGVRIVSLSQE